MESEDLVELVQAVWQTTMSEDISLCADADDAQPYDGHWTATVSFKGDWKGLLLVTLPNESARKVAAAMFRLSLEDVSDDDMHDAAGEVANILGGNVKALLPPPSELSLPSVYKGDLLAQGVLTPETQFVQSLSFRSDNDQLTVRLIEAPAA